jgi:hypothetical protein
VFESGFYFQPGTNGSAAAQISTLSKIEGILNHIYFVKDQADHREAKEKVDHPPEGPGGLCYGL